MKALIADGDSTSRLLLTKIMDMEEIEYIGTADGKTAFNHYLKDDKIDLLFLEWDMMGMDGLEVVQNIMEGKKKSKRDCYTIIISDRGGRWDITKAVEMGVDDLITKPMDSSTVLEALKTAKMHLSPEGESDLLIKLDPTKHLRDEHEVLRFQAKTIEELLDDIDHEAPTKLVDWMSGRSFVLETQMHHDKESFYSVVFLEKIQWLERIKNIAFTESSVKMIEDEHKMIEKIVFEVRENFKKLKKELENPGEYSEDFKITEHANEYPAYCLKDKMNVEIISPKLYKMDNGMFAFKGFCPKCSSEVNRIIGKSIGVSQKHIILKRSFKEYLELLQKHLRKEEISFFKTVDKYLTPADKERLMQEFKRIENIRGIHRIGKSFKSK
jgi:DNA-binding response OmpR family regulator